jgi:serine O-acetyltransferase
VRSGAPARPGNGRPVSGSRKTKAEICKREPDVDLKEQVVEVVDLLARTYVEDDPLANVGDRPLPSRDEVIRILEDLKEVIYPGYFGRWPVDRINYKYYLGAKMNEIYENLSVQVAKSLRHDCTGAHKLCDHCLRRGRQATITFLKKLPDIRTLLSGDVEATLANDPAADRIEEVIFSYPGVKAITVYRIAHELYELGVPVLPRIMAEYAHTMTGIDIHPGARIGERLFIDHGTGVVVGQTCVIGDDVKIYQGVTLGALSLPRDEAGALVKGTKRHPTVEDNVTIYSGATILGGDAVVGMGSVVGGNVWLTGSIPPGTKVLIEPPRLQYRDNRVAPLASELDFQI